MKGLKILILVFSISCMPYAKAKEAGGASFSKIVSGFQTRETPLYEATSFDNFDEKGFYGKPEVHALSLEKVYPDFYKEGYHYKATASYRLDISDNFISLVITILKGENEMESVLINYGLHGEMIDHKIISYDEIAEGWSKIESKIDKNVLAVSNIFLSDERQEKIELFEVNDEGAIKPVVKSDEELMDDVLKQLNLDPQRIDEGFMSSAFLSDNKKEKIVLIPEITGDEERDGRNSHIVIVDSETGNIMHKYFESSRTNGWGSDALMLSSITIDTGPYFVARGKKAFGVRVRHHSNSRGTPYTHESISLYVKSGNALKEVLAGHAVLDYGGEWDSVCDGAFTEIKNTLSSSPKETKGYFDIVVNSQVTKKTSYVSRSGECESRDKVTEKTSVLKFDGEMYRGTRLDSGAQ